MRKEVKKAMKKLKIEHDFDIDSINWNGYYKVIVNIYEWKPNDKGKKLQLFLNDYIIQFKEESYEKKIKKAS